MGRPLLLSHGHSVPSALSKLAKLSILFPDPGDAMYDNLPKSLQHLSLRCCPHHCVQQWAHNQVPPRHWHSPILSVSKLIHILQQCNTPYLDHLQVEYITDSTDPEVLPTIASAFPVLRSLELSRFREPGGSDVSIVHHSLRSLPCCTTQITDVLYVVWQWDVFQLLAGLRSLCSLWLHLDFSDMPQVLWEDKRNGMRYFLGQDIADFCEKLQERVVLLLWGLDKSLEELWLLECSNWPCAQWIQFHVVQQSSDSPNRLDMVDDQHGCKVREWLLYHVVDLMCSLRIVYCPQPILNKFIGGPFSSLLLCVLPAETIN